MKKWIACLISGLVINLNLLSAQGISPSSHFPQQSPVMESIQWVRNYSDAVSQSQSTSKPIAILFTGTSWCPACMKLERDVLTNPAFTQEVGSKFVFLKAEFPDYTEGGVSASPYKPLIDRYNIKQFPTIVVIDSSGKQLFTINYHQAGAQAYAQELLQRLRSVGL